MYPTLFVGSRVFPPTATFMASTNKDGLASTRHYGNATTMNILSATNRPSKISDCTLETTQNGGTMDVTKI